MVIQLNNLFFMDSSFDTHFSYFKKCETECNYTTHICFLGIYVTFHARVFSTDL